ncbi:MAG: hypothetical protein ACRDYU_09195 [Actinomycetes bacterium]
MTSPPTDLSTQGTGPDAGPEVAYEITVSGRVPQALVEYAGLHSDVRPRSTVVRGRLADGRGLPALLEILTRLGLDVVGLRRGARDG